jgi:hypothetical protein
VLDVRFSQGLGKIWLDVEHDRDYVQVQPQPCAKIGGLLEKGESDTCSEKLAKMFTAEVPQGLDDMLLDIDSRLLRVVGAVRNGCRCEIGAVHGVVHTQSYFDDRTTVDDRASDAGPHWIQACISDDFRPLAMVDAG